MELPLDITPKVCYCIYIRPDRGQAERKEREMERENERREAYYEARQQYDEYAEGCIGLSQEEWETKKGEYWALYEEAEKAYRECH